MPASRRAFVIGKLLFAAAPSVSRASSAALGIGIAINPALDSCQTY